ncbi:MAG: hypothetical protein PUE16_06450 [Lactimicrobium massiliense]|nr:hypothetical protein [Lactimicrobium massiliense]MDD6726954.1 hypothetical protein [Lactimicrobium massiliense]
MAEKVLVIDASRHLGGAADEALTYVKKTIESSDVTVEICSLGRDDIAGCIGCGKCIRRRVCIMDDAVNQCNACMWDGMLVLFDVLYEQPDEQAVRFLKRLFYSHSEGWHYVPAACIGLARMGSVKEACRRIEDLFALADMTIVTRAHGTSGSDSVQMDILLDHFLQAVNGMQNRKPCTEIPNLDGFVR